MSARPQDDLNYALSHSLHRRGADITDVARLLRFHVHRPEGEVYLSPGPQLSSQSIPVQRDAMGVQSVHYPFGMFGRYQDNMIGFVMMHKQSLKTPLDAATWVERYLVPSGRMDVAPGQPSPATERLARRLQTRGVGLTRVANSLLGFNVEDGGRLLVHVNRRLTLPVVTDKTGLDKAVYPAPRHGRTEVDAIRLAMDMEVTNRMHTPSQAGQIVQQRLRQVCVIR